MKRTLLVFLILLNGTFLFAQTAPSTFNSLDFSSGTWKIAPSLVSQYMFRGARLGGLSFQPGIDYNQESFGLGLWTNFPLNHQVAGQSDPELDLYGFYLLSLPNKLTLVPGFTLYTYPDAEPQSGYYRTRFEPNLALSYSLGPVQITPKLYYDFQLKGPTAELTASFAVPLANFGTELDFTGTIGMFKWTDSQARSPIDTKNWGDYFLAGVSVPFQFSVSSKITLGWSYSRGTNNYLKQGSAAKFRNPAAVGRGFLSLGYSRTF